MRAAVAAVFLGLAASATRGQASDVVFALNAGGPEFKDPTFGFMYESDVDADNKASPLGISANTPLEIIRAPAGYQHLYQTERYALDTFGYDIPTPEDGEYTLVLRFTEVYWTHAKGKVFDVVIEGVTVVKDLDVYNVAGRGVAHDEYVKITIKGGTVSFEDETQDIGDTLRLEFEKGSFDNPKICAFFLVKGSKEDAAKYAPLEDAPPAQIEDDEDEAVDDADSFDEEQDEEDVDFEEDFEDVAEGEDLSGDKGAQQEEGGGLQYMLPIFFALLAILGIQKIRESM